MNEEQKHILNHYQHIWDTYKQANYMSNLGIHQLKELAILHKQLFKDLPAPNLYCKTCVIDMFKNLFNLYNQCLNQTQENTKETI